MPRPGYSLATKAGGGGQVKSIIFPLAGLAPIAFTTAITLKLLMPERGQIIGVGFDAAVLGGTHSTSTLDVLVEGDTLLTAVFDVAAHTPGTPEQKEGAALSSDAAIVAKDAQLRVVSVESGGSSPLITGGNIQIDYVPLGD